MCASAGLVSWMALELHSCAHVEVWYTFHRDSTGFYRKSTFKIFYIIYILAGFNRISMVINRPLNGLGWSFPVIANLSILL